jgi:hypothetical protein
MVFSGYGGETDVSPDCGRFYGPFVRPRMRMSEGVNEWTIFFNFRKCGAHGGKPKNSDKYLSQCHFVHHKSHWTDLGANPGRRGESPATNRLSYATA